MGRFDVAGKSVGQFRLNIRVGHIALYAAGGIAADIARQVLVI